MTSWVTCGRPSGRVVTIAHDGNGVATFQRNTSNNNQVVVSGELTLSGLVIDGSGGSNGQPGRGLLVTATGAEVLTRRSEEPFG